MVHIASAGPRGPGQVLLPGPCWAGPTEASQRGAGGRAAPTKGGRRVCCTQLQQIRRKFPRASQDLYHPTGRSSLRRTQASRGMLPGGTRRVLAAVCQDREIISDASRDSTLDQALRCAWRSTLTRMSELPGPGYLDSLSVPNSLLRLPLSDFTFLTVLLILES